MNWKNFVTLTAVSVLLIGFFLFAQGKSVNKENTEAREMIQVRYIGHKLLLQAGDSTSRVLPVKQLGLHEYELQFEKPFSFQPDSLIGMIHQLVLAYNLPSNYMVNVIDCSKKETVFGFIRDDAAKRTVIPCLGREQPVGCYRVRLSFLPSGFNSPAGKWLIAGAVLAALGITFLVSKRYGKKKTPEEPGEQNQPAQEINYISIGQYQFYPDQHYLQLNGQRITLTVKEADLLKIFARHPNEVIDRGTLQKEVWENEGVIVTRSLDMFVSKLRKKLEEDEEVRIVNIHGKGYRLEV